MKIAILGATGHVAKCAARAFAEDSSSELFLFSRSVERLKAETKGIFDSVRTRCMDGYDNFFDDFYDVIFNGIGVWDTPGADPRQVFPVTEYYDDMILRYQKVHPDTISIHVSSGSVYGGCCSHPVSDKSKAEIDISHVRQGDYYTVTKLNSEIKHRAFSEFGIVDIRLFGFFSRYMNTGYDYLLSGIIRSIRNREPFHVVKQEFYRDYIHPEDFASMLSGIINKPRINTAIDVRSRKPVSKSEMLDFFVKRYGLIIENSEEKVSVSKTGIKPFYYSVRENEVYDPVYTSMETIESEIKYFLREV